MASKQQQNFRMCVHPCPHYLTGGDTHVLCVACLGEEHARSVLESAGCEHCDVLPLRTLRSRLAFIHNEGIQACVPQGSGSAVAEAQQRLHSWGSQMNLSAELETGTALSLPSPDSFRCEVFSTCCGFFHPDRGTDTSTIWFWGIRYCSCIGTATASARQSRAYEELVEVVRRAVDWPAEVGRSFKKYKIQMWKKRTNASCGFYYFSLPCGGRAE